MPFALRIERTTDALYATGMQRGETAFVDSCAARRDHPAVSDTPFLAVQTESSDQDRYAIERAIIEAAGGRLLVAQAEHEDARIELLREAQAVLVGSAQINRRVIEAAPQLQLIIRYGVGLDTLDIPAATEHGVVVAHYPDFCQPEVANHAIMLLLAVAKKLVVHDRAIRAGRWGSVDRAPAPAIHGQTLGLISLGAIAREVAVRARALGMTVTAYDPYEADATFEALGVGRAASLEELLRGADHVSAHPPLTAETRGMMGAEQFALMKPEAIFVNTSRGPVHDEAALIAALEAGEIGGAGLDVFEAEPLAAESPLLAMDNVVLTPHSASYSDLAFQRMKERVGRTVVSVMRGRWPSEFATIPNRDAVTPRVPLQ